MKTTFVDAIEDGDLAIASALHVAATQVRSARCERAVDDLTRPEDIKGEPHLSMRMRAGVPLDRTTVAALHAELGAWLAAHPAEVDRG